jgi:hypothetical protein
MIYTVPIPTSVSRIAGAGCHPGGDCCDSCRSHSHGVTGPPIGAPSVHVHAIPTARNVVLRSNLGQLQCDQDGNCYDNGTLVSAPLTTGVGCAPGDPTCSSSLLLWAGGAALLAFAIFGGKR